MKKEMADNSPFPKLFGAFRAKTRKGCGALKDGAHESSHSTGEV